MTKKHFIALADDLKRERQHFINAHGKPAFDEMVTILCRFCRGENGRFNEWTFRNYIDGNCGPCGGTVKK